jgi:hypothetical protein
MPSPHRDHQLPVRVTHRGAPCSCRLALAGVAIGFASLALSLPIHAQSMSSPTTTIIVLVYNYVGVSPATLAAAEGETNKILGAAGAQATWVDCLESRSTLAAKELCQTGWAAQTPGLRLIAGTNKFKQAEYGYTAIPVLATIYYDKIAQRAERDNAKFELPILLGCVMAHELGHLLLGTPGHSHAGIMQPEWGQVQVQQALTNHLLFTRQEAGRIQAQARLLARLRPAAGDATFPQPAVP